MSAYLSALGIGFSSGLRTFTAPAVVSSAAHLGKLNLHGGPLSFMASTPALVIFTVMALFEYVGDLLPMTGNRTSPGQLTARILSGGLCGACLFVSGGQLWIVGALLGAAAAVAGAFGGYHARKRLVQSLKVKDFMIAIPEDLVAIGLAYLMVVV